MSDNHSPLSLSDLIQRVKELDKAATPQPWTTDRDVTGWDNGRRPACAVRHAAEPEGQWTRLDAVAMCPLQGQASGTDRPVENAALIAEYRSLCPQLAEESQRLQWENEAMQARVDNLSSWLRAMDAGREKEDVALVAISKFRVVSERVAELEGQLQEAREIAAKWHSYAVGAQQLTGLADKHHLKDLKIIASWSFPCVHCRRVGCIGGCLQSDPPSRPDTEKE